MHRFCPVTVIRPVEIRCYSDDSTLEFTNIERDELQG